MPRSTMSFPAHVARIICIALVAVATAAMLPTPSHAGLNPTTRKNCNVFVKYKLRSTMTYTNGFSQSIYLCGSQCVDGGCGFAEIHPRWYDSGGGVLISVDCRIGSAPNFTNVYTLNSHYHAGEAFFPTAGFGSDSIGIARSSMYADVVVADSAGGTLVTLTNFQGVLHGKQITDFGSAYRCVVWNSASASDTLIRPGNLLLDGSVRIEHGQVKTTGIFSSSDFLVDNAVDSTGYSVLRVRPAAGLAKHLFVPVSDAGNTVALSSFDEVGYGDYDPNFIFDPNSISYRPPLPLCSGLGALAMGAGLLLAGVAARRRAV